MHASIDAGKRAAALLERARRTAELVVQRHRPPRRVPATAAEQRAGLQRAHPSLHWPLREEVPEIRLVTVAKDVAARVVALHRRTGSGGVERVSAVCNDADGIGAELGKFEATHCRRHPGESPRLNDEKPPPNWPLRSVWVWFNVDGASRIPSGRDLTFRDTTRLGVSAAREAEVACWGGG